MSVPNYDPIEADKIKGRECKHAIYIQGHSSMPGAIPDDMIFIKEIVHDTEGGKHPRIRMVENYKRPFWITKSGFRDHTETREWEDIDKLDRYESTQAGLVDAIKKALNIRSPSYFNIRKIANDYPYIYGTDITPTTLIKNKYQNRYPDCISECTMAVFDIETDMVEGHEEPIYLSLTFKDRACIVVPKWYIDWFKDEYTYNSFASALKEHFYKRLPETAGERNIDLEVVVAEGSVDAIKQVFDRAHTWSPDFIAVWNINFDIPRILDVLERYGVDAGDLLSDPHVPKKYRKAWYKEGPSQKVTDTGEIVPRDWYDRWHTFYLPAGFYFVDQACIFWRLRMAAGKEPSYALDSILTKYAGIKKLKNEKADQMAGAKWHNYMQRFEPLEYGIYNLYDCISCEILDEQPKMGDLRLSFYMQAEHSDYDVFNKQPRRTVDDLHFTCLENGKVIAATPGELKTEFDNHTTSRNDWIVTLPAHLVERNGLPLLDDVPGHCTEVRGSVYDLDITSAYPTGEIVLNTSRQTTVAEVTRIEGLSEDVKRSIGVNLTGGSVNAIEICQRAMGAPTLEQLLERFYKDHSQ